MKEWLCKQFTEIKNKDSKGTLVIFLGILGMILILGSELFSNDETSKMNQNTDGQAVIFAQEQVTTVSISTEETYRATLETQLSALIAQMEGAGKTTVMITLVSGEETIYAKDQDKNETQSHESHVLLENGAALTETVRTPKVCGVAVLCQGGDNIRVVSEITSLVTALFDISSTRVSVEKII